MTGQSWHIFEISDIFEGNCIPVINQMTETNPFPGKAPPNLAQGVPPLLANQYIMGPGGLLPAYPVSFIYLFVYHWVLWFVSFWMARPVVSL